MNKKIIASTLSILSVTAMMAGATFAFFSDTGTSNNNTFSTGTLNLTLSNNATTFTDDVVATWGATNLVPGGTTPVGTLTLRNEGSIAGNHVDINFTNVNSDLTNPLDAVMRVTTLTYNGSNLLTGLGAVPNAHGLVDTDASGFLELDELAAQDLDVHTLPLIGLTPTAYDLVMQLTMDPNASNLYQGDNVTTNLSITLQQDISQ